jgi:hypothetical protein
MSGSPSELGADFPVESAPSEKQWAALFAGRSVLILLDELAFYLIHAASKGKKDEGERFSMLTALALTNLFGAIRDHKESAKVAVVVADLQKDWDQGHEDLARIMRTNVSLGGTIQSADNEMSKGAVPISPVDNTKDELYAILRKRLFKDIKISPKEKKDLIDALLRPNASDFPRRCGSEFQRQRCATPATRDIRSAIPSPTPRELARSARRAKRRRLFQTCSSAVYGRRSSRGSSNRWLLGRVVAHHEERVGEAAAPR